MANLKTLCIDGNCMNNFHPVQNLYDDMTAKVPSAKETNIFVPSIVVDEPSLVIIMVKAEFPANATGSRYMGEIRQTGSAAVNYPAATQRVGAAPSGITLLTISDNFIKEDTEQTKWGAKIYQNSGITLNVRVFVSVWVFPSLIG